MKYLLLIISLLSYSAFGQDNDRIDVTRYEIDIKVTDTSNYIHVTEIVHIDFHHKRQQFYLDLSYTSKNGEGMHISGVFEDVKKSIHFKQEDDKVWIYPNVLDSNFNSTYTLEFSGIPKDGLIIGKNRYGNPTYFGDNWPNRAHNWFACVDHPSEKAAVNFTVTAPSTLEVIATGKLDLKKNNTNGTNTYFYKSDIDLSTKVMVIGIADFAIQQVDYSQFPLSSWVYSTDSINAFQDLEPATEVLDFFIKNIGAYPFEELANVQSTTRYGGMENASNIFYDEFSFTGEGTMEALIAHEIAHQWFGNSATESDWSHLWLSEGFATYLTDLYWEYKFGEDAMQKRLISERNKIIEFSQVYNHAVIDSNYKSITSLLNPNSYQKGAWTLHMLRQKIGNDLFIASLQNYYKTFAFGNADSDDFIKVVEETSKQDLTAFFNQWLREYGQPMLKSSFSQKNKTIKIRIEQVQSGFLFEFPIEIEIVFSDGSTQLVETTVNSATTEYSHDTSKKVEKIILDPNIKLLFEELK